jgi:hypothetical protein
MIWIIEPLHERSSGNAAVVEMFEKALAISLFLNLARITETELGLKNVLTEP